MGRSEARLKRGIWAGLRGVSPHAKLLYTVLLTEPTMNHAGVCARRMDLWAEQAELSAEETDEAFGELLAGRFVFADTVTREVLVRTMIRNDGVADQPYLFKGALKEALQTESPTLRNVLAGELRKLPPQRPDGVSKSGAKIVYPDPHGVADVLAPPTQKATRDPLETLSEGSRQAPETHPSQNPFETHSKGNGVGEGVGEGEGVPVPENSSWVARAPARTRTRGDDPEPAPLADDWAPTDAHRGIAQRAGLDVDREADQFRAHAAAHGRKFVNAHEAFRLWLGNAKPRPTANGHLRPVPPLGDRELTNAEVDEILGAESLPNPPDEIARQGLDAAKAWWAEEGPRYRAARHAKALAKISRQAAP